jgi:signal peptidase I
MGTGSDNPYAPSAAVSAEPSPPARWPARTLAILTAICSGLPLLGAGHLILGNARRARWWLLGGIAGFALLCLCGTFGWGRGYVLVVVGMVLGVLAALLDTILAPASQPRSVRQSLAILLAAVVIAQGLSRGARRWVTESFQAPSANMVPTLLIRDYFVVAKGSRANRGDVIVFRYPAEPRIKYVKRVVAVGGDTVEIKDDKVLVNGVALPQRRLDQPCPAETETGQRSPSAGCALFEERAGDHPYRIMIDGPSRDGTALTVPADHLFVMGDNRNNSNDSRMWGTLPKDNVEGQVRLLWWSSSREGVRWDRVGLTVD